MARLAGWRANVPCRVAHRHTTDEGERLRHRLLERAIGGLGWTVCCSEAVRGRMVQEVGSDPLRTEVVYNGVPLSEFGPAMPSGPHVPPTLLTVASLRGLKGHRVLLEVAARLAARGVSFRLQLVGDGPDREYLERFTETMKLSKHVRFLGERDDVPALLARADLFVLPTTGREGLGLAALEAMAAGLPVIASNIGGLPEVVRNGRTGYVVPPGDCDALERAIFDLLANRDQARAMGREGRQRVEQQFSAAGMVRSIEQLYARDLEPEAPRRTILFLSSRGSRFGGGQAGLAMLASGISSAGYTPFVVLPESGDLAAELTAAGVRSALIPLPPMRSLRPDRVVRAALRLRRLARRLRPEIVHADGTRVAAYTLALPGAVRRVWHLRDVRSDPLDPWLAPHFDKLVSVCTAAVVNRFAGMGRDRVAVVPNAVNPHRPSATRQQIRRRLGLGPDDFVLLTAGRVEPQKGVADLIRSLPQLERAGVDARVIVAGEASADQGAHLAGVAARLDVGWRVALVGRRDDLPDLLEAADILVHPSWYEAAPRVVLEAMAAGVAVVATAVGGVPEILDGCGELVPDRDPTRLAEVITRLALDPERLRRVGDLGREIYLRRYTPERHLAAMIDLYDGLVGTRRMSREAA
jgi:glycosyltransferase involved in cell wall biosynthesis